MSLSQEQLETIKRWVCDGSSISEVQTKLKEEFGVVMAYIDVRFLIDDLGAEIVSKPSADVVELNNPSDEMSADSESPAEASQQVGAGDVLDGNESEESADETELDSPDNGGDVSKVKVSVSPIQRPDCIISGDVEFSDGSKAEWRIDRMGQLGIIPSNPTMNPPQEEILEFQRQLQQLLR